MSGSLAKPVKKETRPPRLFPEPPAGEAQKRNLDLFHLPAAARCCKTPRRLGLRRAVRRSAAPPFC
jgi:hypothetical protein